MTSYNTFITTFSLSGYHNYGKAWIDSFLANTSHSRAIIFVDFDLSVCDDRIVILNFNNYIPEHKKWVDAFEQLNKNYIEHQNGIRFSYKSFVMMYALRNIPGYVIWLDSDCLFKKALYEGFAEKILDNKFIAVQVDKVAENDVWKKEEHVESGIVIFNTNHPDKNIFLKKFEELYDPKNMADMLRPYDGFVIRRACGEIGFVDLFPADYTILKLDPAHTFIHPELRLRFIHNIGNKGY